MAITQVAALTATVPGGLGTTAPLDTTGADLLVVYASYYSAFSSLVYLSDSKANSWTQGFGSGAGPGAATSRFWWVLTPTVGTGHTFTLLASPPWAIYAAVFVRAYAGVQSRELDTLQGNAAVTGAETSLLATASGPFTPSANGGLILTGISAASNPAGSMAITAGFTRTTLEQAAGVNVHGSLGVLIQPTAAALNPTWTWTPGQYAASSIVVFTAAPDESEPAPEPEPPGTAVEEEWVIRRLRRAPHLTNEHKRVFYRRFELDLERGQGAETGQGEEPLVMLRLSRDGGFTWSEPVELAAGRLGDYMVRARASRLGHGRDVVFEVTVSDPIAWSLVNAWLELEPGGH